MKMDRIIREVASSMAMEGMSLTAEDKKRIQKVLQDPSSLNTVIAQLTKSYKSLCCTINYDS